MSNDTVVRMVAAGVPEETIIKTIEVAGQVSFRFLPADLQSMTAQKVPDSVVKAMAARAAGKPVSATTAPQPAALKSPGEKTEGAEPEVVAPVVKPVGGPGESTTFENVSYLRRSGDKVSKIDGRLNVSPERIAFKGGHSFEIATSAITALTYERAAKPRYAEGLLLAWPLLFTKSKQHYLTTPSLWLSQLRQLPSQS